MAFAVSIGRRQRAWASMLRLVLSSSDGGGAHRELGSVHYEASCGCLYLYASLLEEGKSWCVLFTNRDVFYRFRAIGVMCSLCSVASTCGGEVKCAL
jgi:hypothetical protein